MLALTKGLARAEGPAIRVNAVAPGPVWAPFWTKPGGFAETLAVVHQRQPMAAEGHELSLRGLPLGRLGMPEEVAKVIAFLASGAAASVTGSVWGIDGGSIRSLFLSPRIYPCIYGQNSPGRLTTMASWVLRAITTTASLSGSGFSSR